MNYEGLWWAVGGAEAGWGINFAHQDDVIFATWFTYNVAGKAWWLTMQQMYTLTFKPPEQVKDKWDLFTLSAPVPANDQPLDILAPTRAENNCTLPA